MKKNDSASENLTSGRSLGQWKRVYQRYFALAFLIAALIHILATGSWFLATYEADHAVTVGTETSEYDLVQPPVKFEIRAPKLAKSFQVSKTPSYSQTFTPREIKFEPTQAIRVQAEQVQSTRAGSTTGNRTEGSIFYGAMTGGAGLDAGWGIPGGAVAFGRSLGVGGRLGWGEGQTAGVDFQPDLTGDVANVRTGGTGLASMRDELVDVSNFADRLEGLVMQDPKNKKKVSGMLNFYQLRWKSSKSEANGEDGWNVFPQAVINFVNYVRDSTDVRVNLMGNIRLEDKQLMSIPFIFMMGYTAGVQYTPLEAKNLGAWLRKGGFLFIDDGFALQSGAFNASARKLLKDALGYDAEFERIPPGHALFHAWEDFDGPPPGVDDANIRKPLDIPAAPERFVERYRYLEGIFLSGRLAVVISNKGYSHAWGQWRYLSTAQGGPLDNARQLHFGVNLVVYATTQKGGIVDQSRQKVASEYQR